MSKTLTFALAEDLAPARLLLRNRIIQYSKRAQLHADFIEIPRIDDLLRVLRTRSPDVLTLDLGFDGVGEEAGLEAIGFIVGSHSNLPILVVSAHQQLEQFSERLAAYPQVLACIHKSSPQFDLQLETALRAAVAWRSADQREAIHSLHLGLEALVANQVETASRLLTRESLLSAFGPSQLEQLEMGLARLIERFPGQDNQRFRCTTTLLRVYMRQGKTWEAFQLAHKLKSEFPERPVDVQSRILQMATVFHRETLALDAALQLGYRLLASQHWQATLDVCDQIDSRQAGIIPSLELRAQALACMQQTEPENGHLEDMAIAARLEWVRALRFNNELKRAHMALKPLLQLQLTPHWQGMLAEEQQRLRELGTRKPETAPYRPVRICGQGSCRDSDRDLVPLINTDCLPLACDICGAYELVLGTEERTLLGTRRLLIVGGPFPEHYKKALLGLGALEVKTHPGTGDLTGLEEIVRRSDGLVLVRGLSPEAGVIHAEACLENQDGKPDKPVATVRAHGPLQIVNAVIRGLLAQFAGGAAPVDPPWETEGPALQFMGIRLRVDTRKS